MKLTEAFDAGDPERSDASEADVTELFAPPEPVDLTPQEIVDAFEAIEEDDLKAVFELMKNTMPPANRMDRNLVDQHLRKILKEKNVQSPAKVIQDWFKEADEGAHAVSDAERLIPPTPELPDDVAVDGRELVEDLIAFYDRYIYATREVHLTSALYAVATYGIELWEIMPNLAYEAPDKECGKTTYLGLQYEVSHRPFVSSNITGPGLFRVMEALKPTLLIDEGDSVMKHDDNLRQILKASHARKTAFATRMGGENRDKIEVFNVFGPKLFTVLGQISDDQVDSRTITNAMEKMPPGVRKEKSRIRTVERAADGLRARSAKWVKDNALRIRSIELPAVDDLGARDEDNWEPLLLVARAIGPEMYVQALAAAMSAQHDTSSLGELLLRHIREAFLVRQMPSHITTDDLLHDLVARDDAPWAHFWEKDLKADAMRKVGASLRRRLKPYGVHSIDVKHLNRTLKGYKREELEPVWERYIRPDPEKPRDHATSQVRGGFQTQPTEDQVASTCLAAQAGRVVASDSVDCDRTDLHLCPVVNEWTRHQEGD